MRIIDLTQRGRVGCGAICVIMYEPMRRQIPQLAFLWPALAVVSASEAVAGMARQFAGLAVGADDADAPGEPAWATPNTIVLELNSVRLRDFSMTQEGPPALLCAPFALHGAASADIAPGYSLIATLRAAGLRRLYVADWRSASADMCFLSIDNYLADLNVLVDHIGGKVDLVGLCQGGWLALIYAARFPAKVRKLVLAGAPVDIAAAPSGLSALVDATPLAVFEELVRLGEGRVPGRKVLKFWGPEMVDDATIHHLLQTPVAIESPEFAALAATFRAWYAWTFDLPGTYYLEVIERLYKRNAIAAGQFVALGETIDLGKLCTPLYLLAARDDELVAPAQLFATERLVGTPAGQIAKALAPCRHLGLFMGKDILADYWQAIARWLDAPAATKKPHGTTPRTSELAHPR